MLTITHENNMDLMARYPGNHFDLAIVDPPYGIGESGGKNRRGVTKHKKKSWDEATPNEAYFKELFRVSKNQVIWGSNYFVEHLPKSMGWICWDKKLDNSDFSDFELAFTSFQRSAKIFRFSKNGGSRTFAALKDIIHPTQKPIELYKWVLHNYANPGDKILDTHLGSGSIAIACHDYNYDLTACELDPDYYAASMLRINDHTSQQQLFKAS